MYFGIISMIEFVADNLPGVYVEHEANKVNVESLNNDIINIFGFDMQNFVKEHQENPEEISEELKKRALETYNSKEEEITADQMRELERVVMLKVVDEKWMNHIDSMDELKNGIGLRANLNACKSRRRSKTKGDCKNHRCSTRSYS